MHPRSTSVQMENDCILRSTGQTGGGVCRYDKNLRVNSKNISFNSDI